VLAGKKKEPGYSALKSGLYATKANDSLKESLKDWLGKKEQLFRLEVAAARLWAALERADRIEYAIDIETLEKTSGKERHAIAGDMLRRLVTSTTVLKELIALILGREKLIIANKEVITRGQVVTMFLQFLNIVREIVADPKVAREDIPLRVAERLEALAVQVEGGPEARAGLE
jgi:hypothetical protein